MGLPLHSLSSLWVTFEIRPKTRLQLICLEKPVMELPVRQKYGFTSHSISASSLKPSEPDDTSSTSSYWRKLCVSPVESWTLIGQSPKSRRLSPPSSLHRSHFTTAASRICLLPSVTARSNSLVSFICSIQEFQTAERMTVLLMFASYRGFQFRLACHVFISTL